MSVARPIFVRAKIDVMSVSRPVPSPMLTALVTGEDFRPAAEFARVTAPLARSEAAADFVSVFIFGALCAMMSRIPPLMVFALPFVLILTSAALSS